MKAKTQSKLASIVIVAGFALTPSSSFGAALTWDGGGADAAWSTDANWVGDPVTGPVNGDTLTFAGTTNLNANNDLTLSLNTGTAITFASGAGSFNLSGNTLTLGSGGGGGMTIIQQNSANSQTISANLNLSGGNGDRSIVFGTGAGSLTLSGNIAFNGDWLFPNTTAGTIVLSGANTGDGKTTNAITAGTNIMRAMMRNNVAGTVLTIGSDGALGNSGTGDAAIGTASLRGIIANQNMTINTIGDRNLSGSSLAINAANITFNGANNLTIGNLVNQSGNRDFVVSSTGTVTVGTGVFLSGDQTGRRIYDNLSGTGGMVVNGKIYDTLHSSGITTNTTTTDGGTTSTKSLFRKAGAGTLALNGDSSTTFNGVMQVESGTVKLGHSGALGASDGTAATATQIMGGTLDMNGQTSGEYIRILSDSSLINSSSAAATISAYTELTANLTVNTTGNITVTRLVGLGAPRTITKLGNGTLATNGNSHNNLSMWDIQAGKVVFANTSGYGADRGVTLNGGTLQISGSNNNLINDGQPFILNSGTFDLNGKGEAVAAIGGSGGTITNSNATTATLYVGGGVSGSSSATYGGAIQNGTGVLNLTKEGSGTQTLTGANSYTGATTIRAGAIALGLNGTISNDLVLGSNTPTVGSLDVTAKSSFSQVNVSGNGTLDIGAGKNVTVTGALAPGFSPGTVNVTGNLTLAASTSTTMEIGGSGGVAGTDSDYVNVTGTCTFDGLLAIVSYNGFDLTQTGSYSLFSADSFSGEFDGVSVGGNPLSFAADVWSGTYTGMTYSFSETTGVLTVIPEPRAALIGGLGFLALLRRRK